MSDLPTIRMTPEARRWPCRLDDRCTCSAVAIVLIGKEHTPACLLHLVELAEACRRPDPAQPAPTRRTPHASPILS